MEWIEYCMCVLYMWHERLMDGYFYVQYNVCWFGRYHWDWDWGGMGKGIWSF